jgi:hypothetical protein
VQSRRFPYSASERLVAEQNVAKVVVTAAIVGPYKSPHNGKTQFVTVRVDLPLIAKLHGHRSDRRRGIESPVDLLSWIAPAVVFFAIWFFIYRRFADRMGAGGPSVLARVAPRSMSKKDTRVTFEDVAGAAEAKQERCTSAASSMTVVSAMGNRRAERVVDSLRELWTDPRNGLEQCGRIEASAQPIELRPATVSIISAIAAAIPAPMPRNSLSPSRPQREQGAQASVVMLYGIGSSPIGRDAEGVRSLRPQ